MNRTMRIWASGTVVFVLFAVLLAACVAVPTPMEPAAAGANVRTERALVVENYITDQGTLDVTGDTTVGGALTVTGAGTFGSLNCTTSNLGNDLVVTGTLGVGGATTITDNVVITGTLGVTGTQTFTGATSLNGGVTIGDGGDTVAVNSSDWDISTTGAMTGIGAFTADGLVTGTAGATISGAAINLNASSNFATNINTGTTNAALTLGGGSGTVAVNSSDWGISTAGVMTGIGAITSDGAMATTSTLAVGTWLKVGEQTAVVVSAGSIITPTGTLQPLTSASSVAGSTSTAIANGTTAGDLLILRNANASDTITINGTGANVECKSDKALGSQDTLMLIWNGSDWVCLSLSDNS